MATIYLSEIITGAVEQGSNWVASVGASKAQAIINGAVKSKLAKTKETVEIAAKKEVEGGKEGFYSYLKKVVSFDEPPPPIDPVDEFIFGNDFKAWCNSKQGKERLYECGFKSTSDNSRDGNNNPAYVVVDNGIKNNNIQSEMEETKC